MMHTVRSSLAIEANEVGEFQQDIAAMDAQLANLTSLCNNIQTNFYDMNKRLDASQERCDDLNPMANSTTDDRQIGTMEAWSLLQSIQHNLDNIDADMSEINEDRGPNVKAKRIKRHKLKHIKSKTRTRKGKRGKTKAQLSKDL